MASTPMSQDHDPLGVTAYPPGRMQGLRLLGRLVQNARPITYPECRRTAKLALTLQLAASEFGG